jgi:hypothetical protein
MLRVSFRRLGGGGGHGHKHYHGVPLDWIYPHGVKPRTFPMRDGPKHPAFAPNPGGILITKTTMNLPATPFEFNFYRIPIFIALCWIFLDMTIGLPVPAMREDPNHCLAWTDPNRVSHHFWAGNGAGLPHHFWCYQPGFYMPNESGAHRATA